MKVYVYNNLEDMANDGGGAMVIEGVTDIARNVVGGWVVETEQNNYAFPADIYMNIDKTEEE